MVRRRRCGSGDMGGLSWCRSSGGTPGLSRSGAGAGFSISDGSSGFGDLCFGRSGPRGLGLAGPFSSSSAWPRAVNSSGALSPQPSAPGSASRRRWLGSVAMSLMTGKRPTAHFDHASRRERARGTAARFSYEEYGPSNIDLERAFALAKLADASFTADTAAKTGQTELSCRPPPGIRPDGR